jgi:hypothetical protein
MVKDGDLHGQQAKEVNKAGRSEGEERWIERYPVKLSRGQKIGPDEASK